jgi:hypothetical protein
VLPNFSIGYPGFALYSVTTVKVKLRSDAARQSTTLRGIVRLFAILLAIGITNASAQGTFGHLAYGAGWQTTFLVVNQDQVTEASVSLTFYSNIGTALSPPVNGGTATSVYSFSIPPNGSTSVVLPDVGGSTSTEGWASLNVNNSPAVSGQAIFRQNPGGSRPVLEAAVPFTSGAPLCLVPFGNVAPMHTILVPFDNTTGVHVTALAFANTTSTAMSVPIEFDDPAGAAIATGTLNFGALNHSSFVSTAKYPATNGKSGVLRITLPSGANVGDLSVLALLADSSSGTLTTLIPIMQ